MIDGDNDDDEQHLGHAVDEDGEDGLFIVTIADWELVAAVSINHLSSVSDKCSN